MNMYLVNSNSNNSPSFLSSAAPGIASQTFQQIPMFVCLKSKTNNINKNEKPNKKHIYMQVKATAYVCVCVYVCVCACMHVCMCVCCVWVCVFAYVWMFLCVCECVHSICVYCVSVCVYLSVCKGMSLNHSQQFNPSNIKLCKASPLETTYITKMRERKNNQTGMAAKTDGLKLKKKSTYFWGREPCSWRSQVAVLGQCALPLPAGMQTPATEMTSKLSHFSFHRNTSDLYVQKKK